MARQITVVDTVSEWVRARVQECYRCVDCGENVTPWDEVCPECGRGKPARVSLTAAIYMAVAFAVLLLLVAVGAWLF